MFALKPDEDIVMVQSGDPERYFDMLRATARPNRAYCARHAIRYAAFHAVLRGFHTWHAAYNRIPVLNQLLDLGWEGWYLHLDADAYVWDHTVDLRAYLAAIPDRGFVFTPGGTTDAWNVNNGVFLANLGHPMARAVIRDWHALMEERVTPEALRTAIGWGDVLDDQHLLQVILRDKPGASDVILHETPRFMNGPGARFIRQYLRANERDPARRLRHIVAETEAAVRRADAAAEPLGVVLGGIARALDLPAPKREEVEAAEAGPDALGAALRAMLKAAGR